MRVPSSIGFLSHPRFRAAWVALAAGSLAGLAVLGACSDAPVSRIAGPAVSAPRLATGTGIVGGTAHKVFVCVDLASDPGPGLGGTYSFAVAMMDPNLPPYPWYELKTSNDPDLSIYGVTQNSTGPFSASTDNDVITTALAVAPGDCAEAFVRADTCVGTCDPGDPADHAGNRLWTDVNGVTNPYASVTITGTTPAGFTMSLICVNDDAGNPQSCTNGGYSSANVFHGSTFTYTFVATANGCTLTPGWWKNQGAATSAQFDFDGGTNNGLSVLNTPPKGNVYYMLAHQYIAVALNVANGATLDGAALAAFNAATAYFAVASPGNPLPAGYTKKDVTDLADVLDDYNNGVIGPGHCDD